MGMLDRLFGKKKEERSYIDDFYTGAFYTDILQGTNTTSENVALKLSTVYRAVNVISDSVAVLPIDNYEYKGDWKYKQYNKLYYLLNVQPNKYMSAFTFKKNLVQNILLKGNGYILIKRNNKNDIEELTLLNSDDVSVLLVKGDIVYEYKGNRYDYDDIIHIMNYSHNGLIGISTLQYASMSTKISYSSEKYAENFFVGGGAMAGILHTKVGANVSKDQLKSAKESMQDQLKDNTNSIVVLGSAFDFQPITISPMDAQLLESRQFNIINICQFFGVPPSKLFDLSKSSYATVEASQIDFLNSTLLPLLEKIEIELYRKLYLPVEYDMTELKFDVSNIIRLDAATQASYFSQLYNMGAISTNEIREKINMNYPVQGGNEHFIQVNLQKLSNPIVNKNDEKNNNK